MTARHRADGAGPDPENSSSIGLWFAATPVACIGIRGNQDRRHEPLAQVAEVVVLIVGRAIPGS